MFRISQIQIKFFITFTVLGLLMAVHVSAQAQDTGNKPEWSAATSLTYPIARIYQVHISYNPGGNHEYFFGPAYQNFTSGSITSHAFTFILGYRYYVWKKLHLEAELWPAYNPMYSAVTELRYRGMEIWGEVKIGYKVTLYRNLFIQPAPGIGFGVLRTNKPPGFSDDINSPIFVPQVIIGLKL
ncbi:MAG: hypothetical protein EA359_12020 [Balneolaceae bacterium]|nr:MAG: hypothetical protein EA359_12020 [Balneolaceae bacterium]